MDKINKGLRSKFNFYFFSFAIIFFLKLSIIYGDQPKIFYAIQDTDSNYVDYEYYTSGPNGESIPVGKKEFLSGCSWYCGAPIPQISATSEFPSKKQYFFFPQNTHDFNLDTAWITAGKHGNGVGESLIYEFNFKGKPEIPDRFAITTVLLANGYKKTKKLWQQNSRIKKFLLSVNDKPYGLICVLDSFEIQKIDIGKIPLPANTDTKLTFEILEIFPGAKFQEAAISELVFDGEGVH